MAAQASDRTGGRRCRGPNEPAILGPSHGELVRLISQLVTNGLVTQLVTNALVIGNTKGQGLAA